jgi:RHS repeat-associated protein
VKSIRRQGSGSEANIDYYYNNMGHRVKKVVKGRNAGAALGQDQWEYTYYVYDAAGNVMAIYDRNYNGLIGGNYADILTVSEQNIYGSSRLGQVKSNRSTTSNFTASYSATDETGALYFTNLNYTTIGATGDGHTYTNNAQLFQRSLGLKEYELSNHLGNVNVVISDRKKSIDIASDGTTDYYLSEVKSYTDFYAFGSVKPGRVYQAEQYRYSFNGQEREHEITGSPSHSSAEYWMYDSRIARRWEIDPVFISELSPYSTYNLNPIRFNDPKGLSGEDAVRKASRSARRASRKEKKELKKEIEKIWDDLGDNAVRSCLKGLRIEELRAIKEKANGDLELFKDFKIWGNPLKPVVVLDKKPNFIVSFFISAEAFFNGLKGSSNELPYGVAIEAEKGGNPHGTHESDKYTSKNILFSIEHEHIELIDNLLSVAKLRDEYYSGARKNLFNTDFGKMSNKDLLWWLIRNYKPILDAGKDELVENYIEDAIKEAHYRNLHPKHDKRLIKIKYTNGNEIYYFKATEHSKIDSTMEIPISGGYKYVGSRDDGSSTRSWTADKDSLFQPTSK